MFCLLFFVVHVSLFSLCYPFSARHFPPLAGLSVVPPFNFVFGFRLVVSPPRHYGSPRKGFHVGFPCLSARVLLQFAFLHLAPPPSWWYAGGFLPWLVLP